MFNTPALLHTEPLGRPTEDVGIFFIDKLFTNVVQTLSAVILEPTIMAQANVDVVFKQPPNIADALLRTLFSEPPPTNPKEAEEQFLYPPLTVVKF